MRITEPGLKCRNRSIEWMAALMMLSLALITAISPATIGVGAFRYMLALGFTPTIFSVACVLIGVTRCIALYYNGRGAPWTARVRAACSVLGAILFSFMALSLGYLTLDTGTISLGVGTHAILAGAEIFSCLRAGADASHGYYCSYADKR